MRKPTLSSVHYLMTLLGEWCVPLLLGFAVGIGLSAWRSLEDAKLIDEMVANYMRSMAKACVPVHEPFELEP